MERDVSARSPEDMQGLRAALEESGQGHLFTFWKELDDSARAQFAADLARLDLERLPSLMKLASSPAGQAPPHASMEPPRILRADDAGDEVRRRGESLIAAGKVAAFTVAGGQGTRLGFDGPKGAFRISPVRNKPLFQLFAEAILAGGRRFGRPVRWYIMTSPANNAATRSFFQEHAFFGLDRSQVMFFEQGVMPAFDRAGRILLEEKHRLALSPDGHGGSLLAMARRGVLADMARHGIECISYFQVDNPLVHCIDPVFIGLHDLNRSEMSSKVVPKADDLERVGNFVVVDGKLSVIEYSDFPEELARARNPDGSRRFDAGNIAIHVLSRRFVERLTSDASSFGLPWHRAEKKVPCVDPASGRRVQPDGPNGIKLESFIFDALPLAENPILYETSRQEEFSPVKNAAGVDSVETARRDMSRRAARWLEAAGVAVPRTPAGEPDGLFEISPLYALDVRELIARGKLSLSIRPGDRVYVGD